MKEFYTTREFAVRLTAEQRINAVKRDLQKEYFSMYYFDYFGREAKTPQWIERLLQISGRYFDAVICQRSIATGGGWDIIGTDAGAYDSLIFNNKAIKHVERHAWRAWPDPADHEKREAVGQMACDVLLLRATALKREIDAIMFRLEHAEAIMAKKKREVKKWVRAERPDFKQQPKGYKKDRQSMPADYETLACGKEAGDSLPLFRYSAS